MKRIITSQVFLLIFLLVHYQEEVSSQSIYPTYGGAPIVYDNSDDDDIGLLLTILLLAGRNRNGNCCNCCNCGNSDKTIPVPYPIPFPTNNAIISKVQPNSREDGDDGDDGNNGNCGNNGNNGGNNGNNGNNGKTDGDWKDLWLHGKHGSDFDKNLKVKFVPEAVQG